MPTVGKNAISTGCRHSARTSAGRAADLAGVDRGDHDEHGRRRHRHGEAGAVGRAHAMLQPQGREGEAAEPHHGREEADRQVGEPVGGGDVIGGVGGIGHRALGRLDEAEAQPGWTQAARRPTETPQQS
jgi:hypothetical protein